MAPLTVDTTSSCGVRTNRRAVRPATAVAVANGPAVRVGGTGRARVGVTGAAGAMGASVRAVIGDPLCSCRSGSGGDVGVGLGRRPGQGQEHLVERGPAQADVVDVEAQV